MGILSRLLIRTSAKLGQLSQALNQSQGRELVINTEIVRRGELVVHSGTAKLKRQSITP
jgi:hypothetical protein